MTRTDYLLVCLMEKAAEVAHAAAKALRFGLEGGTATRPEQVNRVQLAEKISDFERVVRELVANGVNLDAPARGFASPEMKSAKFWHAFEMVMQAGRVKP